MKKLSPLLTGKSRTEDRLSADRLEQIAESFRLWESGEKSLCDMTDQELRYFSEYLRLRLACNSVSVSSTSTLKTSRRFPVGRFLVFLVVVFFAWLLTHYA